MRANFHLSKRMEPTETMPGNENANIQATNTASLTNQIKEQAHKLQALPMSSSFDIIT